VIKYQELMPDPFDSKRKKFILPRENDTASEKDFKTTPMTSMIVQQ